MRQISLLGHRGARGLLAENTLPSLALPFEFGLDGIEFDLQLSKDNELVVYHDLRLKNSLSRDQNNQWVDKPGPAISSLTLKQLKQFKQGRINRRTAYGLLYRKQKAIADQSIPTFTELLEHLDNLGFANALLNIEIKHSPLESEICPSPKKLAGHVVKQIEKFKLKRRCVVSCFNWEVIAAIKSIDKTIKTGCLSIISTGENTITGSDNQPSAWTYGLHSADFNQSVPTMVREFGADYWIPYYQNITPSALKIARQNKLQVFTWTVNHVATMKKLMRWGVDGIITDYPDKLQTAWQQHCTNSV